MFTGLVEKMGLVQSFHKNATGARLIIEADDILADASIGDSISVNGCCLTIVNFKNNQFTVDAVEETLKRTNLGDLNSNDHVNLERSLKFDARLGGHLVQGHIDGVGTITSKQLLPDNSWVVTISVPHSIAHYFIEKGSIAVDGVSLTIFDIADDKFSFALIPHTAKMTTLGFKNKGAKVNIEIDLIAKYVERLIDPTRNQQ